MWLGMYGGRGREPSAHFVILLETSIGDEWKWLGFLKEKGNGLKEVIKLLDFGLGFVEEGKTDSLVKKGGLDMQKERDMSVRLNGG